jgi:hypothetical protein
MKILVLTFIYQTSKTYITTKTRDMENIQVR